MSILIKDHWNKLQSDVWRTLEKRKSAPIDMYMEILRFTRRKLRTIADDADPASAAALSDPKLAKEELFMLPPPEFESTCIELLEGYYEVLGEFKGSIADEYKEELKKFVEEHNLRYRIGNSCKIELSIPGLLSSQFLRFSALLQQDAHLMNQLRILENSVARLDSTDEERNCIHWAVVFLEGIACAKTTNGGDTLGRAIEGCNSFPHEELKSCVKNFYKFTNNYPIIRHSGTSASQTRDLRKDDAMLAVAFALSFGACVCDGSIGQVVLDGNW